MTEQKFCCLKSPVYSTLQLAALGKLVCMENSWFCQGKEIVTFRLKTGPFVINTDLSLGFSLSPSSTSAWMWSKLPVGCSSLCYSPGFSPLRFLLSGIWIKLCLLPTKNPSPAGLWNMKASVKDSGRLLHPAHIDVNSRLSTEDQPTAW